MIGVEAYPACRFYVEFDGVPLGVFHEIGGLEVHTETEQIEEGGNNDFVHQLPGRCKVGNITLKRGLTRANELFKWYTLVAQGRIMRRNLSVVMYDTNGIELTRWNFVGAYPIRWSGPQLRSDDTSSATETLELAHNGMIAA